MSIAVIPFRKGTKSFSIAEKLIVGQTINEIEKSGSLRQTVHNVRNKLKKAGFTFPKKTGEVSRAPRKKRTVKSAESYALELFKEDILKSVSELINLKNMGQTGEGDKKIQIDEGSLVKRTLLLTPKSLIFYDLAKAQGYPGSLSSYVNEMLTKFYEHRGAVLGFTEVTKIG